MQKAVSKSLDRIDRTILETLQHQGRISNVELARKVRLSPSPCLDRVKKLESEGFIEGYQARLNAAKLGLGVVAFIQITLERSGAKVFSRFKQAVVDIAEVEECHMVAGEFDYLLKLRIRNMEEYHLALGRLAELPGVAQTQTYMVTEPIKQGSGLSLRAAPE